MLIISRTPLRVSFFGGGTDYPDYFSKYKGAVLGTTINKYTYISINTIDPFFEYKIRIGYAKTELVKEIDEIQHPSIRECLRFKNVQDHLDIHIFSDLPAKTGLGSSSSFTAGFLNGLYALKGQRVSNRQLAEEACYVEQKMIKEKVGSQDQFHAAFGGMNLMEFSKDSVLVKPVILTNEKRKILEDHLLIFYTGLTRYAEEILTEQIDKTKNNTNDDYLGKMLDMVYESEGILVDSKPHEVSSLFGKLLHKSWELKKKLSTKITNPLIDDAYQKAIESGAYGGKLCGAGGGGFLAFFAPPEKHSEIRKKLSNLLEVNFAFENDGSRIIYMKE